MACCKCCCGETDCDEGQEGKCCCGGATGECCQEGEYCCDGSCEPAPCCSGLCADESDCPPGCFCVEGECVPEGTCCFKDVSPSYSFAFLSFSGTLSLGSWTGPSYEFLSIYCTPVAAACGVTIGDGVFFQFFDGTDYWEAVDPGPWITYPCAASVTLAGTYTLTNCTTNTTDTLTIT